MSSTYLLSKDSSDDDEHGMEMVNRTTRMVTQDRDRNECWFPNASLCSIWKMINTNRRASLFRCQTNCSRDNFFLHSEMLVTHLEHEIYFWLLMRISQESGGI